MKIFLAVLVLGMLPSIPLGAQNQDSAALAEAVGWIRETSKITAQYDYEMSVKIRLLVFWVSRDSVGGGYIRRMEAPGDLRLKSRAVWFRSR